MDQGTATSELSSINGRTSVHRILARPVSRWHAETSQCTRECVKQGSDFALVSGGKVYTLRADKSQIDKFAGERVVVKGRVSGTTISVDSIRVSKSYCHRSMTVVKTMASEVHRDVHHHQEHTDAGGERDPESSRGAVAGRAILRIGHRLDFHCLW